MDFHGVQVSHVNLCEQSQKIQPGFRHSSLSNLHLHVCRVKGAVETRQLYIVHEIMYHKPSAPKFATRPGDAESELAAPHRLCFSSDSQARRETEQSMDHRSLDNGLCIHRKLDRRIMMRHPCPAAHPIAGMNERGQIQALLRACRASSLFICLVLAFPPLKMR